jgi:hypothetical protein
VRVRVQEHAVCPLLRVLFPVWRLSGGKKQTAAQFCSFFVIIREFDLLVLVSSSSFGPRVLGPLLNFVFSAGLHLPALKSVLFFSPRASSRSQHLFRKFNLHAPSGALALPYSRGAGARAYMMTIYRIDFSYLDFPQRSFRRSCEQEPLVLRFVTSLSFWHIQVRRVSLHLVLDFVAGSCSRYRSRVTG